MRLAGFEGRWAEAALVAIFPGSPEDGLTGIGAMGIRAFLDDAMGALPVKAAIALRAAVWLVALAPLFVLGRLALFASLGDLERERVMERLAACRTYAVRSLVLLLKTMGALLYAGDERVRERMLGASTSASQLVRLRSRPRAEPFLNQEHVDVGRARSRG